MPPRKFCRKFVLTAICIVSATVFSLCLAWLANGFFLQPLASDRSMRELKTLADTVPSGQGDAGVGGQKTQQQPQNILPGLKSLQKVNPDIAAWITVPNADISLPVLQAHPADPDFYLDHDYSGKYSFYGSIYADWRSPVADSDARCRIFYGHSLLSGRMFTRLNRYKSLDFYKSAPVFSLETSNGLSKWQVFSVFVTNTLPQQGKPFQYQKTSFANDSDFLNFVYQLRIRSLYNTGVSFNAEDKVLLLSTCSYEFEDFREVVAARKVRTGESDSAAPEKASYNPKVLYPDCWYQKYGGEKPNWPATYEEASKEGALTWKES